MRSHSHPSSRNCLNAIEAVGSIFPFWVAVGAVVECVSTFGFFPFIPHLSSVTGSSSFFPWISFCHIFLVPPGMHGYVLGTLFFLYTFSLWFREANENATLEESPDIK
ncbi:hypothetical protein EVAR_87274_1 [Eumeta japonica]|uniref:Uncharacterized protein n=1 Tax=Eumeta variegata TaxID=151549 RepID=A0A4C1VYK1_EUMVA|nr:hypothetical protein EVAR_87274_1 [Eumeta japonica]